MRTFTKTVLLSMLLVFGLSGCELLDDDSSVRDFVQGIKDALTEGAKRAVDKGSEEGGYYLNEKLKILMPEEANAATSMLDMYADEDIIVPIVGTNLGSVSSILFDAAGCEYSSWSALKGGIILSFNRAAERAAGFESTEGRAGTIRGTFDIFADAITDLSIDEAVTILKGFVPGEETRTEDGETVEPRKDAATAYLKVQTFTPLQDLFSVIIDVVLDEGLITVSGTKYSVNQIWEWFYESVVYYNGHISTFSVLGLSKVSAPPEDISDYVTGKALDGLFTLLAEAEEAIRDNPVFSGASDFLVDAFEYAQDVFGDAI